MGYNHYLHAVPKKQLAETRDCKTNEDLIAFAERYGYEVDYDVTDDGSGWFPPCLLGNEIYELGKYNVLALQFEENRPDGWGSEELRKRYWDYGFVPLSKIDFRAFIDSYRNEIANWYQELANEKGEDREAIWRSVFQERADRWNGVCGTDPIDPDGSTPRITPCWLYEYAIFELVRLYKTFDWENDELVLMGR